MNWREELQTLESSYGDALDDIDPSVVPSFVPSRKLPQKFKGIEKIEQIQSSGILESEELALGEYLISLIGRYLDGNANLNTEIQRSDAGISGPDETRSIFDSLMSAYVQLHQESNALLQRFEVDAEKLLAHDKKSLVFKEYAKISRQLSDELASSREVLEEALVSFERRRVEAKIKQMENPAAVECCPSKCFEVYLSARSLPVCRQVMDFLESPKLCGGHLSVYNYKFEKGEIQSIFNFFILCKSLESDSLGIVDTNDVTKFVQMVSFVNCALSDRDCHTLAMSISVFENLRYLSLRHNCITTSGAMSLATMLWDAQLHLRVLLLDDNRIGTEGAAALSRGITKSRFMTTLSISNNPIGDVGLYCILKNCMNKFRKSRQHLPIPIELQIGGEYEDLATSVIEDDEDHELLQDSEDFERFAAGEATVDHDEDTFSLADDSVYSDNNHMRNRPANLQSVLLKQASVFLFGNQKRSVFREKYAAVRYKVMAVSVFSRLMNRGLAVSTLKFSGCGLTEASASIVTIAALDNSNITSLDLSNNVLGETAAEELQKLVSFGTLSTLLLKCCGLGDIGVQLLSRAALKSGTLQSLDLSENGAGPTGANWIGAASVMFTIDDITLGQGFKSSAPPMWKKGHAPSGDKASSAADDFSARQGAFFDDDNDFTGEEESEADFTQEMEDIL